MTVNVLVLQHGEDDPPLRVGDWLAAAGANLDVRRCFVGEEIPASTEGFDAVVSLGGSMGAYDDADAPWLPATRRLLSRSVDVRVPTLGICLGAQLLAVATGGHVSKGPDGPEIGAYLAARRDAADSDPLFGALPLTPDVMHYHYDVIDRLPPGAVLMLSSTGYPHQAFRVGEMAWGVQFHLETYARTVRDWALAENIAPTRRLGPMLDDAQDAMDEVWQPFVARFVDLAAARADVRSAPAADESAGTVGRLGRAALIGRRLPLAHPTDADPVGGGSG
jgi:GMP synthase-like glutamine amidotransferase